MTGRLGRPSLRHRLGDLVVHLFKQVLAHDSAEVVFVHEAGGNGLVLLHPVYEQVLQRLEEHVAEVLHRVGLGGLAQGIISDGVFPDAVEEQLVGRLEVRAESIIKLYYWAEDLIISTTIQLLCDRTFPHSQHC